MACSAKAPLISPVSHLIKHKDWGLLTGTREFVRNGFVSGVCNCEFAIGVENLGKG